MFSMIYVVEGKFRNVRLLSQVAILCRIATCWKELRGAGVNLSPALSEPSYNMFGRGRLEDLSLLDLSPLQHEHAFGIMVIGAIEDIPLNHV